jgi:hypothetical protein
MDDIWRQFQRHCYNSEAHVETNAALLCDQWDNRIDIWNGAVKPARLRVTQALTGRWKRHESLSW